MKPWWLLAVPIGFMVFKVNDLNGGYKYRCEVGQTREDLCEYPLCDEDEERCKDLAEAMNEAHERRKEKTPYCTNCVITDVTDRVKIKNPPDSPSKPLQVIVK